MKNHANLKRLISNSYNGDLKFAINNADIIAAQDALLEANKSAIGFSEYLKLHKEHLVIKGCSVNEINEQIKRVRDLSSYFINH